MKKTVLYALIIAGLVSGCSLGERDNPYDPSGDEYLAPVEHLEVHFIRVNDLAKSGSTISISTNSAMYPAVKLEGKFVNLNDMEDYVLNNDKFTATLYWLGAGWAIESRDLTANTTLSGKAFTVVDPGAMTVNKSYTLQFTLYSTRPDGQEESGTTSGGVIEITP